VGVSFAALPDCLDELLDFMRRQVFTSALTGLSGIVRFCVLRYQLELGFCLHLLPPVRLVVPAISCQSQSEFSARLIRFRAWF
jgi:hypothetical protein